MAFDPVPWLVEGGARHSAEVSRLVAYLATGGQEGIINSTDLAVLALAVPSTGIRVQSGACAIRNRALGGSSQTYVARAAEETVVDINPTSASGPRTDLVVVRVENPHISGEEWNQPTDVAVGPYVFPRVIENVPPGTTSVHALELGYSAITLARITIPTSTGTITQGMITDLRSVCNPTTGTQPPPGQDDGECDEVDPVVVCPSDGDDGDNDDGDGIPCTQTDYFNWPSSAAFNLKVPAWATHMDVTIEIMNAQIRYASLGGYIRLMMAGSQMFERPWRCDRPPNGNIRQTIPLYYRDLVVPPSMRGKTIQWRLQTKMLSGFALGLLLATRSTQTKITVKFKQKAG